MPGSAAYEFVASTKRAASAINSEEKQREVRIAYILLLQQLSPTIGLVINSYSRVSTSSDRWGFLAKSMNSCSLMGTGDDLRALSPCGRCGRHWRTGESQYYFNR